MLIDIFPFFNLSRVLPVGLCVLCGAGAFLLFSAPKPQQARNILATLLLLLASSFLPAVYGIAVDSYHLGTSTVLNPFVLSATNFFICILLLYPIEVIRPGWLSFRRIMRLLSPALAIILFFWIGCLIEGTPLVNLSAVTQIPDHIRVFNVWGRFILLIDIMVYMGLIIVFVMKYTPPYKDWCEENFSSTDGLSITWLTKFVYGVSLLTIIFALTLLTANYICHFIYQVSLIVAVCAVTHKALSQSNAYPEHFFRSGMDETKARSESDIEEQSRLSGNPDFNFSEISEIDDSFENNVESFTNRIKEWFESEHPYRTSGFQLSDVGDKIPVCRTYLSRIFNEGFGDSFSHVVRDYRLRDAEYLLINNPELSIADISSICGFSSPANFNRTFSSFHSGMTPGRFRTAGGVVEEG